MRYRQLGQSGLTVSVVGLGCNNFRSRMDDGAVHATVSAALDAGVTLFDTADVYGGRGGSEEILGAALRGRRDDVVVATKFGADMGDGADARGSRRYIRSAVAASLRRLGTDWIDLYQLHVPDPLTPLDETLAALHELVAEGKVRYIGSSNLAAWQVVDAEWLARDAHGTRFISAQNQYSLLDRDVERELTPACLRCGVGILPFFPLANGLLTGKYRRGQELPPGRLAGNPGRAAELLTEATFTRLEALEGLARQRGHNLLELGIAGLAAQPAVGSVIAGATSPEQVRANAAAGEWVPSAEDLEALGRLLDG
ncbi:MAG TPA: aldo/keto reductase [Candidatus Dormibacteraeota bacterium]